MGSTNQQRVRCAGASNRKGNNLRSFAKRLRRHPYQGRLGGENHNSSSRDFQISIIRNNVIIQMDEIWRDHQACVKRAMPMLQGLDRVVISASSLVAS